MSRMELSYQLLSRMYRLTGVTTFVTRKASNIIKSQNSIDALCADRKHGNYISSILINKIVRYLSS